MIYKRNTRVIKLYNGWNDSIISAISEYGGIF